MEELIWYIVIIIISAIISTALQPKPPQPKAPSVEDIDVPTAEEGKALAVIFGDVWLKGPNVVDYGDLEIVAVKK